MCSRGYVGFKLILNGVTSWPDTVLKEWLLVKDNWFVNSKQDLTSKKLTGY